MQVLYASSATPMHVRFTQNLAVNKYKTAPLFRKTLQNYCFFNKSVGGVHPKFKKVLFFLAESARNAQYNLLDGDR